MASKEIRDRLLIIQRLDDRKEIFDRIEFYGITREGFTSDTGIKSRSEKDLVMMRLYVVVEEVAHLSSNVLDALPEIPWTDVVGFRNVVAHGYHDVDDDMVWGIIEEDLVLLARALVSYTEDRGWSLD